MAPLAGGELTRDRQWTGEEKRLRSCVPALHRSASASVETDPPRRRPAGDTAICTTELRRKRRPPVPVGVVALRDTHTLSTTTKAFERFKGRHVGGPRYYGYTVFILRYISYSKKILEHNERLHKNGIQRYIITDTYIIFCYKYLP